MRNPVKESSSSWSQVARSSFWAASFGGVALAAVVWSRTTGAAPMPPNDPSVAPNLLVWFTDPNNTYDEANGVWTDSSGNGNDASIFIGARNGDVFEPLILSEETALSGLMEGESFATVMTTDFFDMMKTPHLNDEVGFSELTFVTLLRYGTRPSNNRPVGIGSYHDEDLRPHYNLAADGSIRRDDGFIAGTEPTPEDFFVRGSVLLGDGVDNALIRDFFFDDYGNGFETFLNMDDADYARTETNDDRLYIGDLRENSMDDAIAQIAFYNAALTDDQVESIAEWMAENPNGTAAGGAPRLMAGDADQDLDFDQLDLVKVQIAAKYLTNQPATWGEGDWDRAPGGEPGNPPAGDGFFNQLDIITALSANIYLAGPYAAVQRGGQENDAQTSVGYDATTGQVWVDAPAGTELTSINIDSAAGIFTGDPAQNLGGSFDNDSSNNIFKATFGSSFGTLSFGNVAQAGLSEDFVANDLTVVGSLNGGGGLGNVDLIYVPEPSAGILLCVGILGGLLWRNSREPRLARCAGRGGSPLTTSPMARCRMRRK